MKNKKSTENPLAPKLYLVDDGNPFVAMWYNEETLLENIEFEMFSNNPKVKLLSSNEAKQWFFGFENGNLVLNGNEALNYVRKKCLLLTTPIIA